MLMAKTILSNLFSKYATRCHPFEEHVLPDAFRGRFKFRIDKCIMCQICAIKCPTKCIRIEPETGLWAREVMACIYCGVCADCCPTGCITMTNVYRPPITKPEYLHFHCTPKIPKSAKKDESGLPSKAAVEAAILANQNGDK